MNLPDPLALVGTIISEKYEMERVVGEGGFALVYRARHTLWNRPVAIKVFRALGDLPAARRKELVDSFIQEGRLLADLSERSAAICQARDVGTLKTGDGREMPYMVLEWLEGQSLDQVLEAERAANTVPRTIEATVKLLEPAAEALALAHRKGIAHRDVKPANIFVLGDPRGEFTVKILDFGIAKVVQDAQRLGGSFAQTQGTISSFTPSYGAPEQFSRQHGATGPWTDVFALALIITELMTHAPPLAGDDLTQLAFSTMDPRRRPTPRTFGATIPDAAEAVLRRAVAVTIEERFPSMGEFWDALRASLSLGPGKTFISSEQRLASASGSRPSITELAVPTPHPSPNIYTPTQPSSSQPTGPLLPGSMPPFQSSPPTMQAPVSNLPSVRPSGPRPDLPVGTMPTALVGPALQPQKNANTGLMLAVGAIGALAITALAGGALWLTVLKKRTAAPPPVVTTLAPTSASASAVPPPPTCPTGMTAIPGGKFFMGSDDKKDEEHERPAHQVTLSPYCMDTTEVTVDAYKTCSDKGDCKRAPTENEWEGIDAASHKLYDPLCNIRDPEAKKDHPINCIDWSLAEAYCSAVGKRLATEAEWEYATRGSDGRRYPWGDEPPSNGGFLNACGKECVAWGRKHPDPDNPLLPMYSVDDGFATTAPVGSFPKGASPFGLKDVVGNVWEWVGDWYAPYNAETLTNPKGAENGNERVLRGGAWNGSNVAWVRPTYRFKSDPKLRSHGIGIRCAKTL